MQGIFHIPVILIVGLGSLGITRGLLRDRAQSEGVSQLPWVQEMDPVDFAGTTILGGLRPLFIDVLWMRFADDFHRKDWYDFMFVAETISRLQPNLPRVWEMNAWNMAYNIAASKKQAGKSDEEFQWVLKGIEFQKKGIRKNPDSWEAYDYLAHMLYDKGRYDEYRALWPGTGIDPSRDSILAAREAAKRESGTQNAHYRFAVYVCKRIEVLVEDERAPLDEETKNLGREAKQALEYCREHSPRHKDFLDHLASIDEWISFLDRHLESAKVPGSNESKQSGDH